MAQLTEEEFISKITEEEIQKFMKNSKPAFTEFLPGYIPESTTDLIFMQVCEKLQKDQDPKK